MTEKNVIGNRADGVTGLDGNKQLNTRHADEVNGACAGEMPAVAAGRHELLELVKFLERERLEIEYCQFVSMMIKSGEWRQRWDLALQIDEVAKLLGDDVVTDALEEVRAGFQEMVLPEHWKIFTSSDNKAWRDLQDRIVARLSSRANELEMRPPIQPWRLKSDGVAFDC